MLRTLNCAAPNRPLKSPCATHCADLIHRKVTLCCFIAEFPCKKTTLFIVFCCQIERMLTWELPPALSDKARPPKWHNRWWSWLQLVCFRGLAGLPLQPWSTCSMGLTTSPDMQPSTGVGLLGLALAWITDSSICYSLLWMAMIFWLDVMSLYFTMRMVRHLNRFSREVVESLTLEVFKAQLNDSLSNIIQIQHSLCFCRRLSWMAY